MYDDFVIILVEFFFGAVVVGGGVDCEIATTSESNAGSK